MGWVLSGVLPSTSGLYFTFSKAISKIERDFKLADQIRSWYDMEPLGASKQVDSCSASDARGQKIVEDITYHDRCRYQVGMLWTNKKGSLPSNYFPLLVQLECLERHLDKCSDLRISDAQTITNELDKGYIVNVDKKVFFKFQLST